MCFNFNNTLRFNLVYNHKVYYNYPKHTVPPFARFKSSDYFPSFRELQNAFLTNKNPFTLKKVLLIFFNKWFSFLIFFFFLARTYLAVPLSPALRTPRAGGL